MDVGSISMLAMPLAAPDGVAKTDAGRQFESLLWQMLLEHGAFPAEAEDGGMWSVMGGVVTQVLADELARENDLGFGRALLAQNGQGG
jgi:hypothetical protein